MTSLEIAQVLLERALTARDMAEGRRRIAGSAYSRDEITHAEWMAAERAWGAAIDNYKGAQEHYLAVKARAHPAPDR